MPLPAFDGVIERPAVNDVAGPSSREALSMKLLLTVPCGSRMFSSRIVNRYSSRIAPAVRLREVSVAKQVLSH
jgi:hypothetical protein